MAENVKEKIELEPMMVKPKESPGSKTINENQEETEPIIFSPDEEVDHERINDTSDNTSSQPCLSGLTPTPIEDLSGNIEGGFKRVLPACLFDVALPILDVYSDLSLIVPWYIKGHVIYAGAMTVPLVLHFVLVTFKWFQLEKPRNKRWSWIFLLLQVWPQLRALRVIRLVYKGHPRALEKKKMIMAEIGTTEAFLESIPSVIIMTALGLHALITGGDNSSDFFGIENAHGPSSPTEALTFIWVFVTYGISLATASLGVTKLLQIGPCPVLSEEGRLGGLLTWRFIIAYLAVLFSLASKAAFIGTVVGISAGYTTNTLMAATLCLTLVFLPNMIFSFFSILRSTGCNKMVLRVIFGYPGLWLLSAITFFCVGPQTIGCCSRSEKRSQSNKIRMSKVLTVANVMLTTITYGLATAIIYPILLSNVSEMLLKFTGKYQSYDHDYHDVISTDFWLFFTLCFLPLFILGILFTSIFLVLDQNCCFSKSQNCCQCLCCCGPKCFNFKYHYVYINHGNDEIEICKSDEELLR